jgi:hypothetical protein
MRIHDLLNAAEAELLEMERRLAQEDFAATDASRYLLVRARRTLKDVVYDVSEAVGLDDDERKV